LHTNHDADDRCREEFLAMLAHELRNPLAAATTALFLLEKANADPARQQRAREVIKRQLGNLGRLVDELLDVSRVTRGKIELRRETVDLTALLQRVVQLSRERWAGPRNQQLEIAVAEEQVSVLGDAMRLEQIFSNLVDNASTYSEQGGRISVSLSRGGETCSIRVRDDGIGLAAEAVPKVFSLFFQVDQSFTRCGGGLGIGLTLVRTLVELHSGSVMVRSDGVGKGSEFEVRLPCLASAHPPQEGAPAAISRRVLVVDDQGDVRDTLRELCEAWGHSVEAARDGYAGVEMALLQQPEIALIDIGMPGIDGLEVARRIRADSRGRGIRLIALTGYGSEEQRTQALAAGFDLHLIKPIDPSRLADLLRTTAPQLH
jgi:two-component system, sensor histidine kinase